MSTYAYAEFINIPLIWRHPLRWIWVRLCQVGLMAGEDLTFAQVRRFAVIMWSIIGLGVSMIGLASAGAFYMGIMATKLEHAVEWQNKRDAANGPEQFALYRAKVDQIEAKFTELGPRLARVEENSEVAKDRLEALAPHLSKMEENNSNTTRMVEQLLMQQRFDDRNRDGGK